MCATWKREAWQFDLMAEQQAHSTTHNDLEKENQQLSSQLVSKTARLEAYQRYLTQKQQSLKKLKQEGIAAKKRSKAKTSNWHCTWLHSKKGHGMEDQPTHHSLFIAGILGYGFKDSMRS